MSFGIYFTILLYHLQIRCAMLGRVNSRNDHNVWLPGRHMISVPCTIEYVWLGEEEPVTTNQHEDDEDEGLDAAASEPRRA